MIGLEGDFFGRDVGLSGPYRFRMRVTVSLLQDSSTAWSPCRAVMWPRRRMVEMVGWAEGAKAWRCEGRMRGVGSDIALLAGCTGIGGLDMQVGLGNGGA